MSARTSASIAPLLRWPPVTMLTNGRAPPVDGATDLRGQPAPRPADSVTCGFTTVRSETLVIRCCPLCPDQGVWCSSRVLMGTRDRRVDRQIPVDLARSVGLGEHVRQHPVPRTVLRVATMSLPYRLPRPESPPGSAAGSARSRETQKRHRATPGKGPDAIAP